MSRAEKIVRARELRERDWTYERIAADAGVSASTVSSWLDPEVAERQRIASRASKARRKDELAEYDRRYYLEHKHPCPKCGHRLSYQRTGEKCPGCAAARRERVVVWWAEGLTMREIADRLGWTAVQVRTDIARMRAVGYDMPHRRTPEQVANIRAGIAKARVAA